MVKILGDWNLKIGYLVLKNRSWPNVNISIMVNSIKLNNRKTIVITKTKFVSAIILITHYWNKVYSFFYYGQLDGRIPPMFRCWRWCEFVRESVTRYQYDNCAGFKIVVLFRIHFDKIRYLCHLFFKLTLLNRWSPLN